MRIHMRHNPLGGTILKKKVKKATPLTQSMSYVTSFKRRYLKYTDLKHSDVLFFTCAKCCLGILYRNGVAIDREIGENQRR